MVNKTWFQDQQELLVLNSLWHSFNILSLDNLLITSFTRTSFYLYYLVYITGIKYSDNVSPDLCKLSHV